MGKLILRLLLLVLVVMMGVTMYHRRDEVKTSEEFQAEAQALLDGARESGGSQGLDPQTVSAALALNGKALERQGGNVGAWYQRVRIGLVSGDEALAVEAAEGLAALRPEDYSFQSVRCLVREYTKADNSTQARKCYAQVADLAEKAADNPLKGYDYMVLLHLASDPRQDAALENYLETVPGPAEQEFVLELMASTREEFIRFILEPLMR